MSTLIVAPFPAFSELSSLPLPDGEMDSWFDHQEFSQAIPSIASSTAATLSSAAGSLAPGQLQRNSSIFPNLAASGMATIHVVEKHSSAADLLPAHAPHFMSAASLESHSRKGTMVDEDNSLSGLHTHVPPHFEHTNSHAGSHLSPFSDASTPSEMEQPHSPYSPHHCEVNAACCISLAAAFPSNSMPNEDTDSRATSPSLASDDELSQINQNLQDEKLDTPPFPSIAAAQPAVFPSLSLNAVANANVHANTKASDTAKPTIDAAKTESTPTKLKSKRSRRRNLIRALKEQTADGNLSGSEGEAMNIQPSAAPARSKRSYIALLGDEGKTVDDEEDEAKAASGNKRDRNKASASAYRKRRKIYLDTLEARVANLNDRLKEKDEQMAKVESENRVLKEQVSFLKRLINFKANDEEELKEASNSMTTSTAPASSSSASSSGFGISTSRLSFGQFTTNGSSRHASVFLFLLFSCFLLFNPMWTGMDLSSGLSDSSSAGGMPLTMGRTGRSLLSYEPVQSSAHHPFLLSSAVVKEVNEAAQLQFLAEAAAKKSMDLPSVKSEQNSSTATSSSSVSSSSSSSSAAAPAIGGTSSDHAQAWQALTQLADHFDMEPTSQQFAELVASAYLPLVSILGEAATQAALRDLANGVFFVQHHALLQAVTHASTVSTNSTTFSK